MSNKTPDSKGHDHTATKFTGKKVTAKHETPKQENKGEQKSEQEASKQEPPVEPPREALTQPASPITAENPTGTVTRPPGSGH
jgi:hypothetical protein